RGGPRHFISHGAAGRSFSGRNRLRRCRHAGAGTRAYRKASFRKSRGRRTTGARDIGGGARPSAGTSIYGRGVAAAGGGRGRARRVAIAGGDATEISGCAVRTRRGVERVG